MRGPSCEKTEGIGATVLFGGQFTRGDAAAPQFGDEDPADVCMQNYDAYGLQYETYQRKTNKLVSCVFRALVTYSCPAGTTLNGTQCTGSSSQAATVGSYTCPSGSLSGSSCLTTSTYGAWVSNYFCNAGDGLNGSTCSHTTTSTYGATPVYACDPGDSLSGQTCTSVVGSTYAAFPSGYACNSGDALSGATCSHTTQSAATPVYGCSGGTLSGTTCVGGTTSSTTAYIYLGKKQIAETTNGITQFAHTDALGSPVAHTTNQTQWSVLNRTRYEPYGFTAQGTKPSPATSVIGFTGHVNDADTDLVYMQQRYYDPIAGRFVTIDPVATDASSGRGFSRYAYVDNNPYTFVDPDGEEPNGFQDDSRPPPPPPSLPTPAPIPLPLPIPVPIPIPVPTPMPVPVPVPLPPSEVSGRRLSLDIEYSMGLMPSALFFRTLSSSSMLAAQSAAIVLESRRAQPQKEEKEEPASGHTKNARKSTKDKHQKGDERRLRDKGGEKKDDRMKY